MASSIGAKNQCDATEGKLDVREQLYNDGLTGPAGVTQIPTECITRIRGFMYDLDAKLFTPGNPVFPPADDPRRFYENIRPVLDRHPLARHGEVRATGGGLHVIVLFNPHVELASAADQQKWAAMIRPAQYSLPADPNAPGITALTRAVGSVNSKNNAKVEVIRPGTPIDPGAVEAFVKQLLRTPIKTVATILLGDERVQPCPVCRGEGTRLDVMDHAGVCYARCGKVSLAMLFDSVCRPFEAARKAEGKPDPPPRRVKANKSGKTESSKK